MCAISCAVQMTVTHTLQCLPVKLSNDFVQAENTFFMNKLQLALNIQMKQVNNTFMM